MSDEIQDFSAGNVRLSHWVAGFIFVVVLVMTGWAQFQKNKFEKALASGEIQLNQVETQLEQLRAEKLDAVIAAQAVNDHVQASSLKWSGVVTKLLSVTPLDVFYNSYNASSEGKMTVNALTDTYESAAQLISVLDKESLFSDVFVGSLTKGSSDSGSDVVSFGVAFNVQ